MRSPEAVGPAATVGMTGAYVLAVLHLLPRLSFFPRPGVWSFGTMPGEPAISWYGYVAWALLGGVLAAPTGARVPWRIAVLVPALALIGLAIAQHAWFGF